MAEIFVNSTADSGTGTLRAAIAAAQNGDVILFDSAIFPAGQTTVIYLSSYLTVNKSISIYGGSSDGNGGYTSGATITRYVKREIDGTETEVVVDDDNPALEGEVVLMHVTTRVALDGQAVQAPDAADEWSGWTGSRILYVASATNVDVETTISGLTFQNGLCTASEYSAVLGTATSSSELRARFEDCKVAGNVNSNGYGGGVTLRSLNVANYTFIRCEFRDCKAKSNAGCFYIRDNASASFTDCTFSTNTATNSGGAVSSTNTSANTFTDCTFSTNTATNSGGAVYSYGTSANTFTDCTFSTNTANYGGAVRVNSAGFVSFVGETTTIKDCEAATGSGIYHSSIRAIVGTPSLENCEVVYDVDAATRTTRYFMTTADSGTGSLRAVLAECAANDTVEPDPETFAVGSTVTILLASPITVAKRVHLKGAGRKIVLDGQGACRCVIVNDGQALDAEDVAIVGGYTTANTGSALTLTGSPGVILTRSVVAGAYGYRPIYTSSSGGVLAISSMIAGNYATNAWPGCPLRGVGSTICGNYLNGTHSNSNAYGDGSIYNATPSEVGFVVAPSDTLAAEDFDKDLWKQWDLSLAPESSYATTTAEDWEDADLWVDGDDWRYDTLGLPRKANGAAGAYERYDVDYWLDSASEAWFSDEDCWTTSRTGGQRPSPPLAGTYFINRDVVWKDQPPAGSRVILGQNVAATFSGTPDAATLALGAALTLNGSVESLTVSKNATSSVVPSDELVLAVGAFFTLSTSQRFDSITASDRSTLTLADGIAVSSAAVAFDAATITSSGRAYFATSPDADVSAATFDGVVSCEYGAGASNFVAGGSVVTWDAVDPTISVLIERETESGWKTVAQTVGTSLPLYLPGTNVVRLFDGASFLTTTQTHLHAWLEYSPTITVATATSKPYDVTTQTAKKYKITKGLIMASQYYNRGEAPLFFARVEDSETSAIVPSSSVTAISYTAYKVTTSWSNEVRTPVEGHENVAIDPAAYLDELVDDDPRWTEDETGYNFVFEPDTTVNPIFPDGGRYVVVITIQFANANPAPISYEIEVK